MVGSPPKHTQCNFLKTYLYKASLFTPPVAYPPFCPLIRPYETYCAYIALPLRCVLVKTHMYSPRMGLTRRRRRLYCKACVRSRNGKMARRVFWGSSKRCAVKGSREVKDFGEEYYTFCVQLTLVFDEWKVILSHDMPLGLGLGQRQGLCLCVCFGQRNWTGSEKLASLWYTQFEVIGETQKVTTTATTTTTKTTKKLRDQGDGAGSGKPKYVGRNLSVFRRLWSGFFVWLHVYAVLYYCRVCVVSVLGLGQRF